MTFYHGTTLKNAQSILNHINVAKGGGELGQGFYVGDTQYAAYQWAYHKAKREKEEKAVVAFYLPEDDIMELNVLTLSYRDAKKQRILIRQRNQTRTFKFGNDLIWAYIVGKENLSRVQQIKFESLDAETMINNVDKKRL